MDTLLQLPTFADFVLILIHLDVRQTNKPTNNRDEDMTCLAKLIMIYRYTSLDGVFVPLRRDWNIVVVLKKLLSDYSFPTRREI